MTREDKLALIDRFEEAYDSLEELLDGLPPEGFGFTPELPEAWPINDHLAHLLDADAAIFFRVRVAVAEPGYAIPVWDEEAWRSRLHYEAEDGRRCLALAGGLRSAAAASLRALADADWDGFWVRHPTRGRVGLAELLAAGRDHVAFHAPFIKRNREAFLSGKA